MDVGSCGLGLWFEGDGVAEALDTSFEVGNGSGLGDLVEVGFAEFAVRQALGKHVIGSHEDLVSDGESGAHGAAARLEAVELVLEVAALGTRGGSGGADEHGAQVDIALAGAPALLLASALMVAGTHAGPCGEMVDAEEDAHIDPDLGDQDGGDHPIDPRDLHQQGVLDAIGFELCFDAVVKGSDILLGRFETAQLCRQ